MIDRVRERGAFVRLRHEGIRARAGSLWCSSVHDPAMTSTQVAFALGRNLGNAVTRNRLRRRLKALLSHQELLPGLILVGAGPAATELTFDELSVTLDRLVSKSPMSVAP